MDKENPTTKYSQPLQKLEDRNLKKKKKCRCYHRIVRSARVEKTKDPALGFTDRKALSFLVEGNRDFIICKMPIVLTIESVPKMYNELCFFSERANK